MNKKLLSLIAACLLPMALQAGPGDVNGDDIIDVADIVEILNHLNNKPTSKFDASEADMNFDGSVDQYDVELLAQKIMYGEYIYTDKKEYHLVNQGNRYLNIPTYSSIDYLLTGGYTYKIDCEGNWLKYQDNSIQYDNNWTGKDREATVVISAINYPEITATVKVIQHAATLANASQLKTATISPSGGIMEIPIIGNTTLEPRVASYDFINGKVKEIPSYLHRIEDEIRGNDRIIRFDVDPNESDETRYSEDVFNIRVGDGPEERFRFIQLGRNAPTFEEQKKALKALYESTNGDDWKDNTNWLSDKPINQWHGVNNDIWGEDTIVGDYILRIQLIDNELRGIIPEEFSTFMYAPDVDDASGKIYSIDMDLNGLYGKIPEAVKKSPRWDEAGWDIITQNPYYTGKLFDYDDSNLSLSNGKVTLFVDNKESTVNDIISKNDLTLIFNRGGADGTLGLSDLFVNHFLDYCNKGYGMVLPHMYGEGWNTDETVSYVKELRSKGFPEEIVWTLEPFGTKFHNTAIGSMYLVDKQGQLIQYWGGDGAIPEEWYINQIDSVCRARLGEPEQHDWYGEFYTSTDFSRDGEVTTLQTASVGKGIDIVLMGDAYVDEDIASGKYQQDMYQGMDYFFTDEVYAALRNRFNVYAVTVVSPNRTTNNGGSWKINYDDNICFDYAQRVPNIDMDNVTVINIVNNDDPFTMKGHASMYKGTGVAHIEVGGPTENIIHEAGGHAFAKLADEYILGGYGGNRCPEDQLDAFRQWIEECHVDGMYKNVSATSDPEKVPWAHMLKDERYKNDLGVFEGAWMWPHDLWRASENSVMNTEFFHFNAPSRETIYKRVMKLSEGDSWTYDYEKFTEFDAPIREAYKTAQSRSMSRGTEAQQKRRIESRPPTIYKGTWRDAGKCEKIAYPPK